MCAFVAAGLTETLKKPLTFPCDGLVFCRMSFVRLAGIRFALFNVQCPHVTQNEAITATGKQRRSAIDARTTRHEGYGMSQSRRAMIECIFAGASSTARCADQTSRHRPRRHRLFAQLVFLIEEAPRPIPK
jgi:hypothetical protein